ncbi:MAG: hypothetical protein WB502_02750 [Thermoactinomyces sp.]
MGTLATNTRERPTEESKELLSAAMNSLTNEMVVELAQKAVSAIELLDDILQPETISLLRKLPESSKSLENTLDLIEKLEQTGTLETLAELGEVASSLKASMTNTMVTDLAEKAVAGVELADEILQQNGLEMIKGISNAFSKARQEINALENVPPLRQMIHDLKDPEVLKGMGLMITFLKYLPSELNKTRS